MNSASSLKLYEYMIHIQVWSVKNVTRVDDTDLGLQRPIAVS